MPLIQSLTVERYGWLTMSEFTDLVTIAEMTPGPIAVNSATFVGIRLASIPGALIATLGCILPSCLIVSILAKLYARYKTMSGMQSVLGTLRPVVVALIASAGLSILLQVLFAGGQVSWSGISWQGAVLYFAAFLALRLTKCSPILVMALCGAAGLVIGILGG